jgi:hypothetical protein
LGDDVAELLEVLALLLPVVAELGSSMGGSIPVEDDMPYDVPALSDFDIAEPLDVDVDVDEPLETPVLLPASKGAYRDESSPVENDVP